MWLHCCRVGRICGPQPACCVVGAGTSVAPLLTAVKQRGDQQKDVPFHVPGHKRGRGVHPQFQQLVDNGLLRYDLTEIQGLDFLSSPAGPIAEAQALAARAFGATTTWFLVNGCTGGIHAAIMACAGPGDTLLIARNCHLSAFSAMVLSGCDPLWLYPEVDVVHGIAHCVTPGALQHAFKEAAQAGRHVPAVLLVSPTYYGATGLIEELAQVCHQHGAALIIDEAHGAHFGLHPGLPSSALSCGADAAVQSTHKVLSAMTQGAMLHTRGGRVDPARVSRALQVLQSSSPSYLLMASLDAARLLAEEPGAWEQPLAAAKAAREGLLLIPEVTILGPQTCGMPASVSGFDPLRLTVSVVGLGCSGFDAAAVLENEHSIVPELATQQLVVFAMGPGTRRADAAALVAALTAMAGLVQMAAAGTMSPLKSEQASAEPVDLGRPQQQLTPRDAFFRPSIRLRREECAGRISAELVCPYPPGIPALFPGELITVSVLRKLQAIQQGGGIVTGASDGTLETLLVCCSSGPGG